MAGQQVLVLLRRDVASASPLRCCGLREGAKYVYVYTNMYTALPICRYTYVSLLLCSSLFIRRYYICIYMYIQI